MAVVSTPAADRVAEATEAASRVAAQLGADTSNSEVLHTSNNVVVRFADIVLKVSTDFAMAERGVIVASHTSASGGDSRVWRGELERFADAFTMVAWDTPGCGTSSEAPDDFRMGDYADVLAGFIEALDLGRAHLVGHSWGSALALELCRRKPSMVRSLVLVGAYAGWAGSLPPSEVSRRLEFALRAADAGPDAFDPTSMPGLFSDVMPQDRARELATIMSDARPAAMRTMAHALAEADLRDALPGIDVPTLLVYGDADARSPLSIAEELQRSIPGSTLVVLPGLGHECYLESPETFAAEVRTFLLAQV